MTSYAVLIDGGFVKKKLGTAEKPLGIDGVKAFLDAIQRHEQLRGLRLHRTYWYDAPPLTKVVQKPLQGGSVDLSQTILGKANIALLPALAELPFVALRLGYCTFRGWKIRRNTLPKGQASVEVTASDIEPNVQQKAVDMRLGLDIASLILKKQVSVIVVASGDSDFVPAMKFARREGAQLFLVPLGHSVRTDMLEHTDCVLDLALTAGPKCAPAAAPASA